MKNNKIIRLHRGTARKQYNILYIFLDISETRYYFPLNHFDSRQ